MRVLLPLVVFFLSFPSLAFGSMDGDLSSLSQDFVRLSMEVSQTFPCPFSAEPLNKNDQTHQTLSSLCVVFEASSFLHHTKIREYMRVTPPEKVFAVYWEGVLSPQIFLGQAFPDYQKFVKRQKTSKIFMDRTFLILKREYGTLVIDRNLLPKNINPKTISP